MVIDTSRTNIDTVGKNENTRRLDDRLNIRNLPSYNCLLSR